MKIALGGDHAGFEYKKIIVDMLGKLGHEVKDFGPYSENSVDYPDFVHPVANSIEDNEFDFGVLICGSGNGVSMAANKHQNIRAALCWNTDLASLARQHNDANILSIPARFVGIDIAKEMVNVFISTDFEGGRHQNRVNKIRCS